MKTQSKKSGTAGSKFTKSKKPQAEQLDETADTGDVAVADADETDDIDFGSDEAEEGEAAEAEESEEVQDEPEADEKEAPKSKPKKSTKGTDTPSEPADGEVDVDRSPDFVVVEAPVGSLKLNKTRVPTEDAVQDMARSIRAIGLEHAIVITEDGMVIDGNTRLMAYRQLKRATIPARIAINVKTKEAVKSSDPEAQLQSLTANVARTDMTPEQIAKMVDSLIKAKVIESVKDLSSRTGLNQSSISRARSIYQGASKKLLAALDAGQIGVDAAHTLVTRSRDHAQMDKVLENVLKAGSVTGEAVRTALPAKRSGRHSKSKAGRKPSIAPLSPEALNTVETGVTGQLRKVDGDAFVLKFEIAIVCDKVENFGKFDFARKIQQAVAKLEAKAVRTELEIARKQLTD